MRKEKEDALLDERKKMETLEARKKAKLLSPSWTLKMLGTEKDIWLCSKFFLNPSKREKNTTRRMGTSDKKKKQREERK